MSDIDIDNLQIDPEIKKLISLRKDIEKCNLLIDIQHMKIENKTLTEKINIYLNNASKLPDITFKNYINNNWLSVNDIFNPQYDLKIVDYIIYYIFDIILYKSTICFNPNKPAYEFSDLDIFKNNYKSSYQFILDYLFFIKYKNKDNNDINLIFDIGDKYTKYTNDIKMNYTLKLINLLFIINIKIRSEVVNKLNKIGLNIKIVDYENGKISEISNGDIPIKYNFQFSHDLSRDNHSIEKLNELKKRYKKIETFVNKFDENDKIIFSEFDNFINNYTIDHINEDCEYDFKYWNFGITSYGYTFGRMNIRIEPL